MTPSPSSLISVHMAVTALAGSAGKPRQGRQVLGLNTACDAAGTAGTWRGHARDGAVKGDPAFLGRTWRLPPRPSGAELVSAVLLSLCRTEVSASLITHKSIGKLQ